MSDFPASGQATPSSAPVVEEVTHRGRKALVIGVIIGAIAALGIGGTATAYSLHYADKALPGTTIAGTDVSGMSRESIVSMLQQRVDGLSFSVAVADQSVQASLQDFGVVFDYGATADQVLERSSSFSSQIQSLFSKTEVTPTFSITPDQLQSFSDSLARKAGPIAQPASIVADAQGHFTATPSVTGKAVNTDALSAALTNIATTLTAVDITAEVSDVEPGVTTAEAEAIIPAAQALVEHEVAITDGIDTFTADTATKASWVTVPLSSDQQNLEAPVYHKDKVKKWVEDTAKASNIEPIPTYNNVDASGKVLVEGAKPGKNGFIANNSAAIIDAIVKASQEKQPYSGEFKYDEVPAPIENRQVLPGAENALYAAAAGEKWLEINLGNNSVSAYEGLDRVHGPVPIVPGSPGHETVTGLFHIYLKYDKQDMGCTPDWPYCAKDVPWVSYFHGSYAFHGAPWQDTFGWSGPGGSHGCINMPVSEARWVHQWSEMGTPVVSHY